MEVREKEVKRLKITELLDLDPITVYLDEWEKEKEDGEIQYQGRITIICYDTVLSHYWDSMGEPLKSFFCDANAEYLVGKFITSSYYSYCPVASTGTYNDKGVWISQDVDVNIDMSDVQKGYLLKIIKVVQEALRSYLVEEEECLA